MTLVGWKGRVKRVWNIALPLTYISQAMPFEDLAYWCVLEWRKLFCHLRQKWTCKWNSRLIHVRWFSCTCYLVCVQLWPLFINSKSTSRSFLFDFESLTFFFVCYNTSLYQQSRFFISPFWQSTSDPFRLFRFSNPQSLVDINSHDIYNHTCTLFSRRV